MTNCLRPFPISKFRFIALLLSVLLLSSCCLKQRYIAEKLALYPKNPGSLSDNGSQASLLTSIDSSLQYLDSERSPGHFVFGRNTISKDAMRSSLMSFRSALEQFGLTTAFFEFVHQNFIFFSSTAHRVLFTGYYLPELRGSLKETPTYRYPLYSLPDDLVELDTRDFDQSNDPKKYLGRMQSQKMIPYFTRDQIDFQGALKGRSLELVYTDSLVDNFFLHIQGSGVVQLANGSRLQLGYAGKNGRPYTAIGAVLKRWGELPPNGITMQSIREWISNNPQRTAELLAQNQSYVFFQRRDGGPFGNLDVPLVAERSVASDLTLFPRGALAFIRTSYPVKVGSEFKAGQGKALNRFVLNHDTGGAIKGSGRIDLFTGQGQEAAHIAGAMQNYGELYFLLHKDSI